MIRLLFSLFFLFTTFPQALAVTLDEVIKIHDDGDLEKAYSLFLGLAEEGDVEAQFWVGNILQEGDGVAEDEIQSFYWLKKAADSGHGQAQNHVGFYYYYGHGVEEDNSAAIRYLLMGAEQNATLALFNLENIFNDVFFNQKIDYEKTFQVIQKYSESGYSVADYFLSFFYQYGLGVEEDPNIANRLTENAASAGYVPAQSRLAEMLNYGYGADQNYQLSFEWYAKAAEQGDAFSTWMMGIFYVEGQVVELNYYEAVQWFKKAAEKGLPEGITSLAVMYANGQGIEQDYIKSHDLYLQIATKGFAHAQRALGQMYYHGQGVKSNLPFAKMWLDLAAEQGHEVAMQEAINLAAEMSEEQLAKTEEMKIRMAKEIQENLKNN